MKIYFKNLVDTIYETTFNPMEFFQKNSLDEKLLHNTSRITTYLGSLGITFSSVYLLKESTNSGLLILLLNSIFGFILLNIFIKLLSSNFLLTLKGVNERYFSFFVYYPKILTILFTIMIPVSIIIKESKIIGFSGFMILLLIFYFLYLVIFIKTIVKILDIKFEIYKNQFIRSGFLIIFYPFIFYMFFSLLILPVFI